MDRNSKVLTGCGIGCGAVVIIVIIIGIFVYNFVSDKVQYIDQFEKTVKSLEQQYENFDTYTPSGESYLSKERFDVFLEIRDSLKMKASEFTQALSVVSDNVELDIEEEDKSFSTVLGMIDTGFEALPEIVRFYKYRDELLIKYNFDIGEYYYYYILAYYCYLETDLGDGPNFPIPGNSHGKNFRFDGNDTHDKDEFIMEVRESRSEEITERTNKLMIIYFDNIMNSVNIKDKDEIKTQLEYLEENKFNMPFRGEKPGKFVEFFDNYKDRLRSNYISIINPFEINPIKNHRL